MAQFYENLKVNGYDLKQKFNLNTVYIGSGIEDRMFGIKRTVDVDDSLKTPIFNDTKGSRATLTIQLCKLDYYENIAFITEKELHEISRILFKDGITIVEHKGMCYYGVFTEGTSFFNNQDDSNRQGYLTLTFELVSDKCYSSINSNLIRVDTSKTFTITNKSTASKTIYTDFEFLLLSGNSITITNNTTGKTLSINGLQADEHVYIYGNEKEFVSKIDSSRNIFTLSNGDYDVFELLYGENIFTITCESCKTNVIFQNEMCLI